MKLLSLFSGIGAFEKALDILKVLYELVGFSEIDKYATKSYCAIHNVPESMNLGDITKVDEKTLPQGIDLITYGFPCQDISIAGKQKGLINEDGTQTRSGLFFEALRIIEATQPRVAIAENVKNLVSKKFNAQFQVVLESLEQAGYNNYWQVLNAKDYGIPQNRERVFIVSIRKDIDTGCFHFPEGFPLELRLKDMLEDDVDEKYYLKTKDTNVFRLFDSISEDTNGCIQVGNLDRPTTHDFSNRVYSTDGLARTLMGSGGNQNDKAGQYLVSTEKVMNVGNVNPSGKGQNGQVIDSEGLARTITQEKGEGQKILVREATKQETPTPSDGSIQVFDLYNRREINPDIVGTITAGCSRNGSGTFLVREATKKGYAEAYEGDSINLEQPNSKTRRGRVGHGVAQTLTTSPQQAVVEPFGIDKSKNNPRKIEIANCITAREDRGISNRRGEGTAIVVEPTDLRIRKLTPKECFRLMGFDDSDFDKAEAVNSNTQLYKQAGNSICVPVPEKIIEALIDCGAILNDRVIECV